MAENKTVFIRSEKEASALKGQAAVVLGALESMTDQKGTIEAVTKVATGNLTTRQDPERVVAYYLCIFKKQGIVTAERPVTVAVAAPEVKGETEEPEDTDDADETDDDAETEDDNDEAEGETDDVEDRELETVK